MLNIANLSLSFEKHESVLILFLFLIITVTFFYPCLKSFNTSLIGPPGDNMQYYWEMWWAGKTFTGTDNVPFSYSGYIFFPEGSSLYFQDHCFYFLFLSLLLQSFFDHVTIYNVLLLHTFVLAGTGAFLLIRYLTRNSYISIIGGFIYAFNPSHFSHSLHHMEISSIQFIPFFILFFIKSMRVTSFKNIFLASLFFFLNSLCTWYYFLFGIYFIGMGYLYLGIRRKQIILPDILIKSSIIIGSTLLILSPWIYGMIVEGLTNPLPPVPGFNYYVVDLAALIIPHPGHALSSFGFIENINSVLTGNEWEKSAYLGLINIVIIILTFKTLIQISAKYFLGMISFLLLAMGSFIHVLGYSVPIALPSMLTVFLPFISSARCPSRMVVYVYLFLAIIISLGLKQNYPGDNSGIKRKKLLTISIGILIFFDYFSVCNTVTKVEIPPCYSAMEKENNNQFGILDLPVRRFDARYMMYQTIHGIPIVQGYLSRKPGKSLIDYLELINLEKQALQLELNNIRYIVIHKKLWNSKERISIEEYVTRYHVMYDDNDNCVLQTF